MVLILSAHTKVILNQINKIESPHDIYIKVHTMSDPPLQLALKPNHTQRGRLQICELSKYLWHINSTPSNSTIEVTLPSGCPMQSCPTIHFVFGVDIDPVAKDRFKSFNISIASSLTKIFLHFTFQLKALLDENQNKSLNT